MRWGDLEPGPEMVRSAWSTGADFGWAGRAYMLGPLVQISAATGDEAPMLEARELLEQWAFDWGAP